MNDFSTMIHPKREKTCQAEWIKSFGVTDPQLVSDSETMQFGGLIVLTHPHYCITWDNHPHFWDEYACAFLALPH